MRVFVQAALLLFIASLAQAQSKEWQVRAVCDMRKGGGAGGRMSECAQLAADVAMLLPEKAGPGNVAVLAELSDNLEKAGVKWDAPCRDQAHCPDYAYTLRYAFVPARSLKISKDKTFTALVCREGFSETAPDDTACRLRLLKVLREMTVRARKEGSVLAIVRLGGGEADAIRPDGQGVAGYELVYSFVQLSELALAAGDDPKAAGRFALEQIAEPAPAEAVKKPAPPVPAAPAGPAAAAAASGARQQPAAQAVQPPQPKAQETARPALSAPPAPAAQAAGDGEIVMQVAALPTLVQAETVADRLSARGIESSFERAEVNGREVYRVLAKGRGNPDAFRQKLAEMGYPGAIQRR